MTALLVASVFALLLCALGWLADRGLFDRLAAWLEADERCVYSDA